MGGVASLSLAENRPKPIKSEFASYHWRNYKHIHIRGCTLAWLKILELFKDRKSVILGAWVAPGALETLQKGGGRSPPPFARVSGASGAAQTPKMTDLRPLNIFKNG